MENALTCECGEFDESTGANYVDNDHCGISGNGGRFLHENDVFGCLAPENTIFKKLKTFRRKFWAINTIK